MNIDQLKQVRHAQPFRPFTIQLADGNELHVPHPEFMWWPPKASRTVCVAVNGDLIKIVDTLHITSIEIDIGKTGRRKRP